VREISAVMPIVVCGGYADDKNMVDIENDQRAAMIRKPYKPDQLRNTLMALIDRAEGI